MSLSLSVIIPTLNEENYVVPCLKEIRKEFVGEILVADGQSTDGSLDELSEVADPNLKIIESPRGLARQCNTAALIARGDTLLFWAADTRLEAGWLRAIEVALKSAYVHAGGFRLAVLPPHFQRRWPFKVISWGGNYRSQFLNIALADQGLFVRKETYLKLGGMDPTSLIPHADLCQRIADQGELTLLRKRAYASPRKWEAHGTFQTSWNHVKTYLRYKRERTAALLVNEGLLNG